MRYEDIVSRDDTGPEPEHGKWRTHTMNERRLMVAGAAGVAAFAATKYGVLKMIPAVGPVPSAVAAIILGLAITGWVEKSGTLGAAIEGVGIALVVAGALELSA